MALAMALEGLDARNTIKIEASLESKRLKDAYISDANLSVSLVITALDAI